MDSVITLNEVLVLARQLSPVDKVRLIEQIAPQIERELQMTRSSPRKSLRGIWQGSHISAEGISELRQEM